MASVGSAPGVEAPDVDVAGVLAQLRLQGGQAAALVGRPTLQPEQQQQKLSALEDMLWRIERCFKVSHRFCTGPRLAL